jgi:DNA-binding MarR family transcriptional regulator
VRSGYLVRERDSADRRRISIYHTDKSAQLIADFYVHLAGQVEAQFGTADDASLTAHISLVQSLTDAADRTVADFEKSGENLRSATQGRAALTQQANAAV